MTGAVLAFGRSGTAWVAYALREAAGIDAHHERVGPDGAVGGLTGVEVNSHLRHRIDDIRAAHPEAEVVHLVRDGRDVVRSAMSRKPEMGFTYWCKEWAAANDALHGLPRYRLEDLTENLGAFADLAQRLDGHPNGAWSAVRNVRRNATDEHTFPHWTDWTTMQVAFFDRYCGEVMREMGYA